MGEGATRLVTLERMLEIAAALVIRPAPETVPLADLPGRVLAADVLALVDVPAYEASEMDGYGLRAGDGLAPRRIVGESAAGSPWPGELGSGEAIRISTGAAMPAGVDAVLRREDAEEADGSVTPARAPSTAQFVRRRGEVIRAGETLLPAGAVVAAHAVGAIGAVGNARALCRRRPRVAILASGDELTPLGEPLGPSGVYDSSRFGIRAQAEAAGAHVVAFERIGDDRESTVLALGDLLDATGAARPDLVLTTGGISGGRHDHLRASLLGLGVQERMWGMVLNPCRPTWLGAREDQVVLGLPGNPVSAAVAFHLVGRPLLGLWQPFHRWAPLGAPYATPLPIAETIRCRETDGALWPMANQGSHAITSLAGSTALALVPAGAGPLPAGRPLAFVPFGT